MKLSDVTILLLCFVITNCKSKGNALNTSNNPEEIPVIELQAKDTFLEKTYVANIQAVQNVEVRNKVEGYLDKIYVDEGQEVRKGQLLFSINPTEYRTAVAKAEAALSSAVAEAKEVEVQVKRVKLLVEKDIISPTELEMEQSKYRAKQAQIAQARSTLANARTNLSYTYIRAPFNGIINRIPFKVGSLLNEGTLLTTVSDIGSVYAYFNVAEDEYLRYLREKLNKQNNSSNAVQLRLADGSSYKHEGKIETTTSEFEPGTGSIAFRAKFPNPNKILHHGASGEIVLSTKVTNVLLLPQKSVFEIQDRNYVYIVDSANTVKMKSFVPRTRMADFYIVQAGLKPGQRVVYEGTQSLKEGMRIRPQKVDMDSLMQEEEGTQSSVAQSR